MPDCAPSSRNARRTSGKAWLGRGSHRCSWRRTERGLLAGGWFLGSFFIVASVLCDCNALAQSPELEGHWVATMPAEPGANWIEVVEIAGGQFESKVRALVGGCFEYLLDSDKSLDTPEMQTLKCRGELPAFNGALTMDPAPDSRLRVVAPISHLPGLALDGDPAVDNRIRSSLLFGMSGTTATVLEGRLQVTAGDSKIEFVRLTATDLNDAILFTNAFFLSEHWPCIVATLVRVGPVRAALLGAGRVARWKFRVIERPIVLGEDDTEARKQRIAFARLIDAVISGSAAVEPDLQALANGAFSLEDLRGYVEFESLSSREARANLICR